MDHLRNGIDEVLERDLNEEQYPAVIDESREVLCLACAGSGKSRTLAYRIARLVAEGEPPDGIVAFTFTEKAADSIKLRVAQALEAAGLDSALVGAMYIGTIHAYCNNILGEIDATFRQFDVLDDNKLVLYLISRYPELGLQRLRSTLRYGNDRYYHTIKEVADAWKVMNDEVIDLNEIRQHAPLLGGVLAGLQELLERDQFVDFSRMIRAVVEALEDDTPGAIRAVEKLRHLMVDEYQDVNPSQERLIQALHERSETLFVVGDDDQAIYAWRGADVENILQFDARYPNHSLHTLSLNYRSTSAIVESADGFIHQVLGPQRVEKEPRAQKFDGPRDFRILHFADREEEAEWVAQRIEDLLGTEYIESEDKRRGLVPADFAILMRSTAGDEQDGTSRHTAFTRALNRKGIPYTLSSGGGLFDRPQVAAVREALELLQAGMPRRTGARELFDAVIQPAFPMAAFQDFVDVTANWGRRIHAPGERSRIYPQQLLHDMLGAFGVARSTFDQATMADLGVLSKIMEDVESVYLSIDSPWRFTAMTRFLDHIAESGYDAGSVEIEHRPNAVSVLTVHKAKGLEFPVVFVVDSQRGRFPRNRSSYQGWLPDVVMTEAEARGAYQSTREEEARLFYTALTRAERFLYVTGCELLPGGTRENPPSPFSRRLDHEEIQVGVFEGLPEDLVEAAPRRRINETILPTSFSEIKTYLRCPAEYRFGQVYGFSPPIDEMFGFGITVHAAVGRLHQIHANDAPTLDEARTIAEEVFHLKHVAPSNDPEEHPGPYERAKEAAIGIVSRYAREYRDDFSQLRQVEARFEIPLDIAVISGAIDLLLRVDEEGRIMDASVVDFKTMEGGPDPVTNPELDWIELSLQVQLYARAAIEVLGEPARTGHIHLLKDNQRIEVPVDNAAVEAATENVEWAVSRILEEDFPMRPAVEKCRDCDFRALCARELEEFDSDELPPPVHLPSVNGGRTKMIRVFSEFEPV